MLIILLVLSLIVSGIILNGENNIYKKSGNKADKIGFGKIIIAIIGGLIFVFGCFLNLIGACGGDLSDIYGQ